MVHSICAVLAAGAAGTGDFSGGVADFAAFPPRRNCSIGFIRFFTCAFVSAGADSRLQTLQLLTMRSLHKSIVGEKFPRWARFRISCQWSRRLNYTPTG